MSLAGVDPVEATAFWRQLAALLRAGLPLPQALGAVGRDAESAALRRAALAVQAALGQGEPFSQALRRSGFEEAAVACVEAGEKSGALPAAADVLAAYGEKTDLLRRRGRMVLTYPAVLLMVGLFTSWIVAWKVIPTMAAMHAGLGADLPLPTRFFLFLLPWFVLAALVGVSALVLFGLLGSRLPGLRRAVEGLLLRLPFWGRYYRALLMARFTRTLALLLGGGVPLAEGLALAGRAAGNALVEAEALAASRAVQDGEKAGTALRAGAAFSPTVVWSLKAADEHGELVETLFGLADYFDETAALGAGTLLAAVEPLAIAGIGILLAGMVLAMALPLFGLITHMA